MLPTLTVACPTLARAYAGPFTMYDLPALWRCNINSLFLILDAVYLLSVFLIVACEPLLDIKRTNLKINNCSFYVYSRIVRFGGSLDTRTHTFIDVAIF